MDANFPWTEIIMQAGYAGILVYLTFRIFKLMDLLVDKIQDIKLVITVTADKSHNQASETES
jgi:hypothetical protein